MEQAGVIKAGKWAGAESGRKSREDSKVQGLDWLWGLYMSPFTELHGATFLGEPGVSQNTRHEPVCTGLRDASFQKKKMSCGHLQNL